MTEEEILEKISELRRYLEYLKDAKNVEASDLSKILDPVEQHINHLKKHTQCTQNQTTKEGLRQIIELFHEQERRAQTLEAQEQDRLPTIFEEEEDEGESGDEKGGDIPETCICGENSEQSS